MNQLSPTIKVRIGKKRVLVIPKVIAKALNIDEGTVVEITVEGDKIVIKPVKDAIWLSLYGKKVTQVTLKELEKEGIERQKEYMREQANSKYK